MKENLKAYSSNNGTIFLVIFGGRPALHLSQHFKLGMVISTLAITSGQVKM